MGNGVAVCGFGDNKEEAARACLAALKGVGYRISPESQTLPDSIPDVDTLFVKIEGYGRYQIVYPPIDQTLGVVKAGLIYSASG